MSDNGRKSPTRDYEVGYGKPPKHTRFKRKDEGAGSGRRRRSKRAKFEPIDISKILAERIPVTKNGATVRMTPFEVALRAQVKMALKERSQPALKEIIKLALEFKLVKRPPEAEQLGPKIYIPKNCPEEISNKICNPDTPAGERWELLMQWGIVQRRGGKHAE